MCTLRQSIVDTDRAVAAQHACTRFLTLPHLNKNRTIALYAPIRDELATQPLAQALMKNHSLVYPRINTNNHQLDFCLVKDTKDLVPGPYQILQPSVNLPSISLINITIFVVPGLAFDRDGWRLGWGHGYYDRLLSQHPAASRVGFALHQQMLTTVPHSDDDESMDWIITNQTTIKTSRTKTVGAKTT